MPLNPNAPIGDNIAELHSGNTYAATAAKHGKATADRQAIAIAERTAGNTKKKVGMKKFTKKVGMKKKGDEAEKKDNMKEEMMD